MVAISKVGQRREAGDKMLSFNKDTFSLVINIPEGAIMIALADFKRMNEKMASMVLFLESKDTPKADKDKFEPLYLNLVHTVSQSASILKAMGIPKEEIRKHCKF